MERTRLVIGAAVHKGAGKMGARTCKGAAGAEKLGTHAYKGAAGRAPYKGWGGPIQHENEYFIYFN